MKIVVACDSYKGCMYSKEVAQHIENGILKQNPQHEVWKYTIADGGEGTVSAFCDTCDGQLIEVSTVDAYMKKIKAQYTPVSYTHLDVYKRQVHPAFQVIDEAILKQLLPVRQALSLIHI